MKNLRPLLCAVSLAAASAAFAETAIPDLPSGPKKEKWDLELAPDPEEDRLGAMVKTLEWRLIGPDVAPLQGNKVRSENIPSLNRFLDDFKKELGRGSSEDREKVVANAETAFETIRLGYNKASAASKTISRARDTFQEVSQKLALLLGRNRNSLNILESVSSMGQATSGGMAISPPASNGSLVPIEMLCSITSLEPELKPLREKLRWTARSLQEAQGQVADAKKSAESATGLAQGARALYTRIMVGLNKRPTSGQPTTYYSKTQSPEVILNANQALEALVAQSQAALGLMAVELDPEKDGLLKAVDKALDADARTMNARVLGEQHGARINYNHAVRMRTKKGLIPRGWAAADDDQKSWWEGRAGLAKSEAFTDSNAMFYGSQEAQAAARDAERPLQVSQRAIAEIDRLLGPSQAGSGDIAARPRSWKPPPPARAQAAGPAAQSTPLRNPQAVRGPDRFAIMSVENKIGSLFDGDRP